MKLEVLRINSDVDSTSCIFFNVTDGRKFLSYALEDEFRNDKVKHETRVPAGTYQIKLRTVGGFHGKYTRKYILIHTGNTDEHTSGCLIVGDSQENNQLVKNGFIGKSVQAYKRIYPAIADAILNGEEVIITYIDYDKVPAI